MRIFLISSWKKQDNFINISVRYHKQIISLFFLIRRGIIFVETTMLIIAFEMFWIRVFMKILGN